MQYIATTSTHKILKLRQDIRLVAGGTSASKTVGILQVLIDTAQSRKNLLIDAVSETMPHMRGGAMLDFENIMKAQNYWDDACWNKTLTTYTFETGTKMHFFSADAPSKAHGPRRDILFINEGNNIPWPIVDHLMVRTREVVWVDWNPSCEYWAYTEIINNPAYRDKYDFITLTYKDNEALDDVTIQRIEAHKSNKMWWQVYGLGQLGEIEGRIFTGWQWIDNIPFEAKFVKRALDFGFTNDPTGIIDIYQYNGGFIFDERCYQYGMSNEVIAEFIKSLNEPNKLVVADSSEPKSIARLRELGINVVPAVKGKDSVNAGIDFIQSNPISATKRSLNLKKEYERYIWLTDRLTGKFINEAPDTDNHLLDPCFAPDTMIYTTNGKKRIIDLVGTTGYLYSRNGTVMPFSDVRPTAENVETVSIEFDDGNILTVTLNHMLLNTKNEWVKASSLKELDMIQSVTYGTNIQWKSLSFIQWREIFQSWNKKIASCCLGILQWRNTKNTSHTSYRPRYKKQFNRKFIDGTKNRTPTKPHNTRTTETNEITCRVYKTVNKKMASFTGWYRMAQTTGYKLIQKTLTNIKNMRTLSQNIRDHSVFRNSTILPPELQNESPTKTVTRITRGFCPLVYNLEVSNTHCMWADGVIAHNCRYGLESFMKKESRGGKVIKTSRSRAYSPMHVNPDGSMSINLDFRGAYGKNSRSRR